MRLPRNLQTRLALSLGILLTLLWIGAASITAIILRHEIDTVFDSALEETAQRLLPLAVVDIVGRDDSGNTQRLGAIRLHDEYFTYLVRDEQGRILLQSHDADPSVFPPYDGSGFSQTQTHRLYSEDALQGTVRMTIAEPLSYRASMLRQIQMSLALPVIIVIPTALILIILAVRASVGPLRHFQERLASRNERDLSPVPADELPGEVAPLAATLNSLLERLKAAFDAERSFAANAAHELRTPLAGAIAQAQRLQSETNDAAAARRAADIETTLKRLTRHAERLMQLARAEGGRLRLDQTNDLRAVLRAFFQDYERTTAPNRIVLHFPVEPVLSDIDPDIVGILCRNLIDNALRYGAADRPVDVSLDKNGTIRFANDGAPVPADVLSRLSHRFERGGSDQAGSGLGLSIVATLAERLSSKLVLKSPRPGQSEGFEASIALPVVSNQSGVSK